MPPNVESPVPPFATERSVPDHHALSIEAHVTAPRALICVTDWLEQAEEPAYSPRIPVAPERTNADVSWSKSTVPDALKLVVVAFVVVALVIIAPSTLVRLYPPPSMSDVHGVWFPAGGHADLQSPEIQRVFVEKSVVVAAVPVALVKFRRGKVFSKVVEVPVIPWTLTWAPHCDRRGWRIPVPAE